MGKLKLLELENFKSYKSKVIIGPFHDFSCIIGPNGSGKSNMMDAISFVLGVQSKHLRSSNLRELIYKKDALSKPESRGSVKLSYELSENELEGFSAGSEITFCRTITQSGLSTYKFNDKDLSFEDYDRILLQLGILTKVKNFLVFQGDIESIASKSPSDLTQLIEQISGSDQYKSEYVELLSKKDSSEESILFLMQKKKMYASQCKEAKIQKDEADIYQKKVDELRDLKTEQSLLSIWKMEHAKETHLKTIQLLKSDIVGLKENEAKVDDEIQAVKKDLANLNKTISSLEKHLASKGKQLSTTEPELDTIINKMKSISKRKSDLESSRKDLERDRLDQVNTVEKLTRELQNMDILEETIRAELLVEETSEVHMDSSKVSEYSRLREQVSGRVATQKTEATTIEQELASKRLYLQGIEAQHRVLADELSVLDKRIEEYSGRVAKLGVHATELENERKLCATNRDSMRRLITEHQGKLSELEAEHEEVSTKLREAGDDRKRSKNDERVYDAIETMKKIFNGVHGKLVDLCHPIQKKYAQAISVAAGSNMDAIVVDSKQIAADCIRYLKDQRVCTCLVLPLDNISYTPVPDRLRTLGNKYKLCVDLVECDEKFKVAVNYALGTTIVCDTLEDAQDLCFRRGEQVRAVTLRGYVISRSGAMTGGMPSSRDGQDRWEDKDIERLRKRKQDLEELIVKEKQLIPSRQQLLDSETKLKTIQTKLQFCSADEKVVSEKLDQYKGQRSSQENTVNSLNENISRQRKEIDTLVGRINQLHETIREVEQEVFSSFSASMGVTNIREYEETKLKNHRNNISRRRDVAEKKLALSAQLEYESKRNFTGALSRNSDQIADCDTQLASLDKDESSLNKRKTALNKDISDLKATLATRQSEKLTMNLKFKQVQTERDNILREKDNVEKKIAGEDMIIEKLRSNLSSILQRAQVEEISLPVREVRVDSLQADSGDKDLLWTGSRVHEGGNSSTQGTSTASRYSKSFIIHSFPFT
jgi:structural maintenance of chromosome 1